MSNTSDFVVENGVLTEYVGDECDVVIPNGVTAVGDEAFCDCCDICSIVIPEGVTAIGEDAFAWCYGLRKAVIPKSVTEICWSTFKGCEELVIHAPSGSYAEAYAADNEFPFVAE